MPATRPAFVRSRRTPPPEGVIGWYRDLLTRLEAAGSDVAPDAGAALAAVESPTRDTRFLAGEIPSAHLRRDDITTGE